MAEQITPLRDLIPDFAAMLEVAGEAVDRANAAPSDRIAALSACLIVWHLHDWTEDCKVWKGRLLTDCPWGTARDQVANAFKHSGIRAAQPFRSSAPISGVGTVSGYGSGGFGVGNYGTPYLGLEASRFPGNVATLVSMTTILNEALAWWVDVEALKFHPRGSPPTASA